MQLKELAQETYDNHYKLNSKNPAKSFKDLMAVVKELGEDINIKQINTQTVNNFIQKQVALNKAAGTINRKLMYLSKMFTYAEDMEYISKRPKIKQLKVRNEKILYFSELEQEKLLEYFLTQKNTIMYCFCVIGFNTGMRSSEIINLTDEDIEDNKIRVWINKSSEPRSIPMNNKVKEAIKMLSPEYFQDEKYYTIRRKYISAIEALGLNPEYSLHTMRHTFCSRLVNKGIQLTIIQQLAGHSSIEITQRYAHLHDDTLTSAVDLL